MRHVVPHGGVAVLAGRAVTDAALMFSVGLVTLAVGFAVGLRTHVGVGPWLAALGLLYGAGIGIYHAGAEWGFWAGPMDCGGGTGANPAAVTDFLSSLKVTKVVDCSTASLRVLGVSLAGWSAAISTILASWAGTEALRS